MRTCLVADDSGIGPRIAPLMSEEISLPIVEAEDGVQPPELTLLDRKSWGIGFGATDGLILSRCR